MIKCESGKKIYERVNTFCNKLEKMIELEIMKDPVSPEDRIRKCAYCSALEQVKTALENILAERDFNDYDKTKNKS